MLFCLLAVVKSSFVFDVIIHWRSCLGNVKVGSGVREVLYISATLKQPAQANFGQLHRPLLSRCAYYLDMHEDKYSRREILMRTRGGLRSFFDCGNAEVVSVIYLACFG